MSGVLHDVSVVSQADQEVEFIAVTAGLRVVLLGHREHNCCIKNGVNCVNDTLAHPGLTGWLQTLR